MADLKFDLKSFERVLNDPELYEQFKIQAQKDLSLEYCIFKEAFTEFKENPKPEIAQAIYNNFLKRNSTMELNVPSHIRIEFLKCMATPDHVITPDDFEPVWKEVHQMMYNNTYMRFLLKQHSLGNDLNASFNSTKSQNQDYELKYDFKCFERVLRDPTLYERFKIQVEKDLVGENCFFWECYLDFKNNPTTERGHSLFNNFIKRNADYELNIPSHYREDLSQCIENNDTLTIAHFEPIMKEVKDMMYKNTFKRFLAINNNTNTLA